MIDLYFELSAAIERGNVNRDYRSAIAAARATYPILAEVVREWKREYGRFDIGTSHAVHTAPSLMAILEDREGIAELRTALEGVREPRDIRLPKAPAHWEARQQQEAQDNTVGVWGEAARAAEARADRASARRATPRFAVEGEEWRIISDDKLAPDERPDPAYKDAFPTGGSSFWLDPQGRREGFAGAASVLR